MRIFLKSVFGILPLTLLAAPAALAAQPSWKQACIGPEHVCSPVKGEAASNSTTVSKAKPQTAKLKSAKPAAVASEIDKPSKVAKKKIAKAKTQDDEDVQPAKKSVAKKKVVAKAKVKPQDEDRKSVV